MNSKDSSGVIGFLDSGVGAGKGVFVATSSGVGVEAGAGVAHPLNINIPVNNRKNRIGVIPVPWL